MSVKRRNRRTRRAKAIGKPEPIRKHTTRVKGRISRPTKALQRYWAAARAWANLQGTNPIRAFFGPRNPHPFSNHAHVRFQYRGKSYPTSEHVYMAEQARHFGFHELAQIWAKGQGQHHAWGRWYDASNPKHLKSWSTKVFGGLKRNTQDPRVQAWEHKKTRLMFSIVQAKFGGNLDARRALLATGSQYLVEASPHDRYWGAGTNASDKEIGRMLEAGHLPGSNRLGSILMSVRTILARQNHTYRAVRRRTIRYQARQQARRDTKIAKDKEQKWAQTAAHFAFMLVPKVKSLGIRSSKPANTLPMNGIVIPPANRRATTGQRKRLQGAAQRKH